ncbi:MAG: endonuclease/exonuclease/phosphatase family protein [Muribaculaceae bacterium]|nr:endonuclease/exonuclease/phosphatase family protein [Muribaculaceae bacterium]
MAQRESNKAKGKKTVSGTRKVFRALGLISNIACAVMLFVSAYSGHISPQESGFATVLNMSFPLWILLNIINLAIDLLMWRRFAIVPVAAFASAIVPILNFSPLNITSQGVKSNEKDLAFTVLNYNVMDFIDNQDKYPNNCNRTISYILSTDADIVCLQECEYLQPLAKYHVTESQIDSLKTRYPYRVIGHHGQATLSKYPFTNINLGLSRLYSGDIIAHLVEMNNRTITLFNVHLRSLRFNQDDRDAYLELTGINSSNDTDLSRLLPLRDKLYNAARHRARQANIIRAYLDQAGGNAIVCGDFNDVPNCYAIRTISGDSMNDAYAENAFGPTITFNANRFYFRIDHVLYCGNIKAVDIERGDIPSSDHYPLLTTFVWQEN